VGNATASGRGRIWHHSHSGALKKVGQLFFADVAGKFNVRIPLTHFSHRLHISRCLRMVSPANHQFDIRHRAGNHVKGLDYQFEPLVGPPFPESQNAMHGVATPGKIWEFGSPGQNAVRT
jgi:hypothetical protein